MKEETIEALCKHIAPTTPTAPLERGRIADLLMSFGRRNGPCINAMELSRLVEMRLRHHGNRKGVGPEKIIEEIEATLDLVEMCEFILEARRRQSGQTQSKMFSLALEKRLTDEEKQIKATIEGSKYPLDFATGLIRMGVGGDKASEREAKWWEYFKHAQSMTALMKSGEFLTGLTHFELLPEAELREAFEAVKETAWENADVLWHEAQNWLHWRQKDVRKKRREAGKSSAAKRQANPRCKK